MPLSIIKTANSKRLAMFGKTDDWGYEDRMNRLITKLTEKVESFERKTEELSNNNITLKNKLAILEDKVRILINNA